MEEDRYKLTNNPNEIIKLDAIKINGIYLSSVIPCDVNNIDYKKYLLWLEKGNIPEESSE